MTFLEVLDRRGAVARRVRIERFPFTIGRAYTNDLILDDPHVSSEHARVDRDEDGTLVIHDLDSRNGVHVVGRRGAVTDVELRPELRIRLGQTLLRLRDRDHPVEPAIPVLNLPRPVEWFFTHWSAALVLLVAVCLATLGRAYRETWSEFTWVDLVNQPIATALAAALWAGGWALVTRFLVHRPRFVAHWAITCGGILAGYLGDEAMFYARFLIAPVSPLQLAEIGVSTTVAALLLLAHLTVAAASRPLRRTIAAALIGLSIGGLRVLQHVRDEPDWVSVLPYWSRLKPTAPALLPTTTADAFFQDVHELRTELDELAAERAEEAGAAEE